MAKFALGLPEYERSGTSRPTRKKGSRQTRQYAERLPLLDSLLSPARTCYLLYPGYKGLVPRDAPVYLPKAIAQGYGELPDAIVPVGPERVPWGRDPYDPAFLGELSGFAKVVHLKPTRDG